MTWSRITISARAAMPFSRPTSFERLARNFESFRKPRTGLPILFLCASLNRNEGRHEIDAPSFVSTGSESIAQLPSWYGCGPIALAGDDNAFYERHLIFDH